MLTLIQYIGATGLAGWLVVEFVVKPYRRLRAEILRILVEQHQNRQHSSLASLDIARAIGIRQSNRNWHLGERHSRKLNPDLLQPDESSVERHLERLRKIGVVKKNPFARRYSLRAQGLPAE